MSTTLRKRLSLPAALYRHSRSKSLSPRPSFRKKRMSAKLKQQGSGADLSVHSIGTLSNNASGGSVENDNDQNDKFSKVNGSSNAAIDDRKAGSGRIHSMVSASLKIVHPGYKQRQREFRKIFKEVPLNEKFVIDYSCALQKEVLFHGRLYLSMRHLCFYANIIRWEARFAIPFSEVCAVTKERTAKVIPNAIQVVLKSGQRLFFTSLTSREKTFLMIFRLWQYALLDQPLSPGQLWDWVQDGYDKDELSSTTDEDMAEDEPDTHSVTGTGSCSSPSAPSLDMKPDLSTQVSFVVGDEVIQKQKVPSPPLITSDDQETCDDEYPEAPTCTEDEDSALSDGGCGCAGHSGREMLNCVFSLSVDQLFLLLFTDNPFYRRVQSQRAISNFLTHDWRTEASGTRSRQISYTVALNHTMGPKESHVKEKQTVATGSKPGRVYIVRSEVDSGGVPYSDSFFVVNQYCLSRVGKQSSRLRVHASVQYRKQCWGIVRNFIDKNALISIQDYFEYLEKQLRTECSRLGVGVPRPTTLLKGDTRSTTPPTTRSLSSAAGVEPSLQPRRIYYPASIGGLDLESLAKTLLIALAVMLILNVILFVKLHWISSERHQYDSAINFEQLDTMQSSELLRLLRIERQRHLATQKRWIDSLDSLYNSLRGMEDLMTNLRQVIKVAAENTASDCSSSTMRSPQGSVNDQNELK